MIIKLNPTAVFTKTRTEAKIVPIRKQLTTKEKIKGDRMFGIVFILGSVVYTVLSTIL